MDLPSHFYIDRVIFLELFHYDLLLILHNQLDFVFLKIRSRSFPAYFFYQIIHRHEDSGTSKAEFDYEAFCFDFLSSDIEEQVDKAFNYKLL